MYTHSLSTVYTLHTAPQHTKFTVVVYTITTVARCIRVTYTYKQKVDKIHELLWCSALIYSNSNCNCNSNCNIDCNCKCNSKLIVPVQAINVVCYNLYSTIYAAPLDRGMCDVMLNGYRGWVTTLWLTIIGGRGETGGYILESAWIELYLRVNYHRYPE